MITAVCRNFNLDEKELAIATKRLKVMQARALVSHIATRGFVDLWKRSGPATSCGSLRREPGGPEGWE